MTGIEHGGRIDCAIAVYGGTRAKWLDLSTGINAHSYPLPHLDLTVWKELPDCEAESKLLAAARIFWNVPNRFDIVVSPGTSALIAAIPRLMHKGSVQILSPTYGEHATAFRQSGWQVAEISTWRESCDMAVVVNPNNPDGRVHSVASFPPALMIVVDESFADAMPGVSVLNEAMPDNMIVLKSFGKFWGLAGLRLGFAICPSGVANPLKAMLGPWAVSGPALAIATKALSDLSWRNAEIGRLQLASSRLQELLIKIGFEIVGGTPLFTLVKSADAAHIHHQLARSHILIRKFSYRPDLLRFGLPGREQDWQRLVQVLGTLQ